MAGHDPPPCSRSAHDQKGKCRTTREFLCSRSARPLKGKNKGQPDCPLCSQSPHDETVARDPLLLNCNGSMMRAVKGSQAPLQERVKKGRSDGRNWNSLVALLKVEDVGARDARYPLLFGMQRVMTRAVESNPPRLQVKIIICGLVGWPF
jgi:hypothetical protein